MDDLISRKAALEALGEMPENWTDTPEEIEAVNSWCFAADVINSVPSVDAVPLDKLCELLERNAAGRWNGLEYTAAGWKDELTRWAEKQDATEKDS